MVPAARAFSVPVCFYILDPVELADEKRSYAGYDTCEHRVLTRAFFTVPGEGAQEIQYKHEERRAAQNVRYRPPEEHRRDEQQYADDEQKNIQSVVSVSALKEAAGSVSEIHINLLISPILSIIPQRKGKVNMIFPNGNKLSFSSRSLLTFSQK